MSDYGGTYSDVSARIPGARDLTASSKPSQSDATAWISDAEAKINNALRFIGASPVPLVSADLVTELKAWSLSYAEGMVRRAYASAGGAGDNEDGSKEIADFEAWIAAIMADPSGALVYFSGGSVSAGDSAVRGTSASQVVAPQFTIAGGAAQF